MSLFHGVAFGHEFYVEAEDKNQALVKLKASPQVVYMLKDYEEEDEPLEEDVIEIFPLPLRQDSPGVWQAAER